MCQEGEAGGGAPLHSQYTRPSATLQYPLSPPLPYTLLPPSSARLWWQLPLDYDGITNITLAHIPNNVTD